MIDSIRDRIIEYIKRLFSSRLTFLSIIFASMFIYLVVHLFNLQIVNGDKYQNEYISMTEKILKTPSTRGNIYDRNGNILATNTLAYDATIQDIGTYRKNAEWNSMLYKLVSILNSHGSRIQGSLELELGQDGQIHYTASTKAGINRFLRDYYGLKSVDDLDDERGRYPSDITAKQLFEKLKTTYQLDQTKDREGNPVVVSDDIALQILSVRYTMRFTAFQKYEATTISTDLTDEAVADILEHSAELAGVQIVESTNRVYNEAEYFAPIIGYTGKVTAQRLEELKLQDDDYELNDVVGRTGIESSMELQLKGKKGSETAYVDNVGKILSITDEVKPIAGNDIYLTIDLELQKGIYYILEHQLAGVLMNTIVNLEPDEITYTDSSNIKIPVKDAYFQLINNNVISLDHFTEPEASDTEKEIYQTYVEARAVIENDIRRELTSERATPMNELTDEMRSYMQFIYSFLSTDAAGIIRRSDIDPNSPESEAWKSGSMSLHDYLYYGIANNWIDTTNLSIESKYSDASNVFDELVDFTLNALKSNTDFTKRIYRYLINKNAVTGRQLMMVLFHQGILEYDASQEIMLETQGESYAYSFLMSKINSIEITPAQLALDPCTASCVVTSAKTGEVLALVTYPSYDNNKINDIAYFAKLNADQSLPLRNNATQTLKAPGSTFKPISAIAGLEEGIIQPDEPITCTGIYEEVTPNIKCWKYPNNHGPLNVVTALENSCNYYFSEVAHRFATDAEGNYDTEAGLEIIQKYAEMFGLGQTSGIEIFEASPEITHTDPERSAMGQGTHSYSNVQLARYVTALANRGTLFNLSLIDKETDPSGDLIKDYTPEIINKLDIQSSTWDYVQRGMRQVVTNSSTSRIFHDLDVSVAGKTGTAQESEKRGNHAFFVSFAPYENPEIVVTVNIPNGYSSSNAALAAKHVYRYYYKNSTLEQIMNSGALDASNERINGD